MQNRAQIRATMKPRYWHAGVCAVLTAGIFGLVDSAYIGNAETMTRLGDIWWLAIIVPFACGAAVTLGCGGTLLWKRIVAAAICGVAAGILYTAISAIITQNPAGGEIAANCVWRMFVFALVSTIGAIATELKLSEPQAKKT